MLWLCGVVVLLGGCRKAPAVDAGKAAPVEVTFVPAWQQETVDFDTYVGRTEPSETVEVRTRVYGYIQEIQFEDGQQVKAGEPLFQIERDTYDAIHKQNLSRIAVAEAKLELAETKLARQERLFKQDASSKNDLDEAVAGQKEAAASVVAARADADVSAVELKYTVVSAPISGRIDRAFVTRGNLVTGGTPTSDGTLLTRIVKNSPLYVYFDVDELSFLKYREGFKAASEATTSETRKLKIPCELKLGDEKDFQHRGVLDFAESKLNAGTGSIQVRGRFENTDNTLIGGLFVQIRVPVSEPYPAIMIPEQAISSDQGAKFAYVLQQDDTAIRKVIEPGLQQGRVRIVKGGLAAGDRVVVKGGQRVRPGVKLAPKLDAQATEIEAQSKKDAAASAKEAGPAGEAGSPATPAAAPPVAPVKSTEAEPQTTTPAKSSSDADQ